MKPSTLKSKIIKTILLLIVASLFIIPLFWMILASLKNTNEVFSQGWLPTTWKWSNYKTVWTNSQISMIRSYFNSFAIVILGSLGQLTISSLAAYAFAKINFRGRNIIFMLFLSSMMIVRWCDITLFLVLHISFWLFVHKSLP